MIKNLLLAGALATAPVLNTQTTYNQQITTSLGAETISYTSGSQYKRQLITPPKQEYTNGLYTYQIKGLCFQSYTNVGTEANGITYFYLQKITNNTNQTYTATIQTINETTNINITNTVNEYTKVKSKAYYGQSQMSANMISNIYTFLNNNNDNAITAGMSLNQEIFDIYGAQYTTEATGNQATKLWLENGTNTNITLANNEYYQFIAITYYIDTSQYENYWENNFPEYISRVPQIINISITYTMPEQNGEIVDVPGLMFTVLGMPFAFVAQAFNLTIFPGTAYAVNLSHIFLAIVGAGILIFVIKKILK